MFVNTRNIRHIELQHNLIRAVDDELLLNLPQLQSLNLGYNLLEEKYPENKKYMSERKRTHFEGFQDKFESDDKELLKQVKSDVELAVINNSNK